MNESVFSVTTMRRKAWDRGFIVGFFCALMMTVVLRIIEELLT